MKVPMYDFTIDVVKLNDQGKDYWFLYIYQKDKLLLEQHYQDYFREEEVLSIGLSYVKAIGGKHGE